MFLTSSAWFLLLLLIVPLIIWRLLRKRRTTAINFSSIGNAAELPPSWRQRLRWLPPTLGILAIIFMMVALARPQEGRKQTVTDAEGIAIELVVDRSGSMQALDFELEGEAVDRLTAIKDVAGKFVTGGENLDGRFSDLIGLITFAGFADSLTPPTLDHSYLTAQLQHAEIATDRSEDGTAIGDAIGLAIEKLSNLDDESNEAGSDEDKPSRQIKSKVVILLTDGENNAGELDPLPAAELAKALGIKIYTIGVGTKGQAPVPVFDPLSNRRVLRMMQVNIDEDTLKKVAAETGGKYFRATDTQSLANIYAEIDELEKSYVEARHFVDYRELAIEPVHFGWLTVPPLVLLALLCLVAQVILRNSVLRQVAA
jgi:Ca-activated chloride channel family protein